jgi:hypothetical protein
MTFTVGGVALESFVSHRHSSAGGNGIYLVTNRRGGALGQAAGASRFFSPIRVASYLLFLYAMGHTLGAVINVPRFGAESDGVAALMQSVHVKAQGADCTWFGFYRGFGAMLTFYMLFAAAVAWFVGGMNDRTRSTLLPVAWALCATQIAGVPLVLVYFFPMPMAFQSLIALLLVVGCVVHTFRKRSARAVAPA